MHTVESLGEQSTNKICKQDTLRCAVCGEAKAFGIHVFQKYICETCEQKIVHTEVESLQYRLYVRKLRNIFTLSEMS